MSNPLTAADPTADADRLRRFCLALLAALDSANGAERLPALSQDLLRVLGSGVGEVADGLRREIAAWEIAAEGLRNLPGRYLTPTLVVPALLTELDAARSAAAQVADALDAIRGAPLQSPAPAVVSSPRDSVAPPVPTDLEERVVSAEPSAPTDDTVEFLLPPASGGTEQAARVFADAEAYRRQRDSERAEVLYTEVVRIDPRFGPAYSRRGQLRTVRGDLVAAVADFTTALELDDAAAEAWWWRGDAHAVAGRPDDAVADYERALALRPDLTRARFNLGVALRQTGATERALAEFDRVLEERPTHAAAHLNRGLIRLQTGDRGRAAAEFRAALRLDPTCQHAHERLDALTARSAPPAAPTAPAIRLVPAPRPAPTVTVAPKPTGPKPVGPRPPKAESAQVAIKCPGCGEAGAVPWDRLGKVLVCGACKRRFGVKAGGATVELIGTADGKWVEAPLLRQEVRRRRKQRLMLVGAVLAAVLLPVGAFAGWKMARPEPVLTERELPLELADRAELFAQAWLCNDVRLMKRLTAPTQDKLVYAWYNRTRPPAALRGPTDGLPPPDGTKIEVSIRSDRPGQSVVRVRISNPIHAPNRAPFEMTWVWEELADTWFFLPPVR